MFVTLSFIMLSIIRKSKEIIGNSIDWELKKNSSLSNTTTDGKKENMDTEDMRLFVYDVLRVIKDPERDATLEELNVIQEDDIKVTNIYGLNLKEVKVEFKPTIPHCNLATLIGLCIRVKLDRNLPQSCKTCILIKPGSHNTEHTINKQINDKERAAAAMENPSLRQTVELCIKEDC